MVIINIFGPSGSGKTTLIRNAIQAGVVDKWLQELTDNAVAQSENPRVALSTMPVPKFRGSVESYLNLFGIEYEKFSDVAAEILALYNTIFPLEGADRALQNSARPVETLSAGEGRRLSVLRCLLEAAELRVIDEPFANSHHDLNDLILSAIKVSGNAILLTHDAISKPGSNAGDLIIAAVEDARLCLQRALDDR